MFKKKQNEDLSSAEQQALARLKRQKTPPAALESATLDVLRAKGLLASKPPFSVRILPRLVWSTSLALVFFMLGLGIGRQSTTEPPLAPSKPMFALFIHDTDESAVDDRIRTRQYANWVQDVRATGRFAIARKLTNAGRLVRVANQGLDVENLTIDRELGKLRGYVLIEADNLQEAIQIASTNPHLGYKGLLAIRQVEFLGE